MNILIKGSIPTGKLFQAVSNSSEANEGYLVTTAMMGERTEEELRILSAMNGQGEKVHGEADEVGTSGQ